MKWKQITLHTFETGIFRIWILATLSDALSRLKNTCCGTFVTSTPLTWERKKEASIRWILDLFEIVKKNYQLFCLFLPPRIRRFLQSGESKFLDVQAFMWLSIRVRVHCTCTCGRVRARACAGVVRLLCLVRISNALISLYLENVVSNFHVIFLQYTPTLYFFNYDSCNSVN